MPEVIPQSAQLLSWTADPEILLERAGRTCYKSENKITPESAPKFVSMICQRNHESVLEHASATIVFTTDRGVTHELVRHRIASFSQESTRYVKYKEAIKVIEPLGLTKIQRDLWWASMCEAEDNYMSMIHGGCTPEVARDVLPTCLKADIVVTANFREWKHIIKLRTSPAAHPKIRELIGMAQALLRRISPTVFQ